jgi:hypothetical protein
MYGHSRLALTLSLCVGVLGCGSSATVNAVTAPSVARLAHWSAFAHVNRPLDLAGPRSDGSIVLAAAGRLWLLAATGIATPFASAYRSPGGEEPYIAVAGRGCFGSGTVYALKLSKPHGVLAITRAGRVRRFALLSASGLEDGIAFDQAGRFGHRLLVTINAGSRTTVAAIACDGAVTTITSNAPRLEGGIAVAPRTFGRFGGYLIAPDETGGRIFAITPGGGTMLVARSGLPHGPDVGVESETFLPSARRFSALLADRLTPGNPHPGDDLVLRLSAATLRAVGVRGGDLLVATEGGARTDAISCGARVCRVRHVADGPAVAHAEGHIGVVVS